jgi:hypothetical protein
VLQVGGWALSVPKRNPLRSGGFLSRQRGPSAEQPWRGLGALGSRCFSSVLEFELRASTLSQSTSPFFCAMGFFEIGSL